MSDDNLLQAAMPTNAELVVEPVVSLTEYSPFAAGLAEMRRQFKGVIFDMSSGGEEQARVARRTLVSTRTALEDKRKELKAPALERSRLIDAEAKRIEAAIRELEEPIDAQIKVVEDARAAEKQRRLDEIAARVQLIRDAIVAAFGPPTFLQVATMTAAALVEMRSAYEARPVNAELYGDLIIEAQDAKVRALQWLDAAIESRTRQEAEEADLKRRRDAFLEEQREATARAAAEKKERDEETARRMEERRLEQERIDADREAEQRRIDAERADARRKEDEERAAAQKKLDDERREFEAERAQAQRVLEAQRQERVAEEQRAAREATEARERQLQLESRLQAAAPAMHQLLVDWRDFDQPVPATALEAIDALHARRDELLANIEQEPSHG